MGSLTRYDRRHRRTLIVGLLTLSLFVMIWGSGAADQTVVTSKRRLLGRGTWNPSCSSILVRVQAGKQWSLHEVAIPSGSVTKIASVASGEIGFPCWSPEGRVAYSVANDQGTASLSDNEAMVTYEYDLRGKTSRLISRGSMPAYSPDGRWVSIRRGTLRAGMYLEAIDRVNLNVMKMHYGSKLGILPRSCTWSHDSRAVCFYAEDLSHKDGFFGVYAWCQEGDQRVLKHPSRGGMLYFSQPRWSHDSRYLDFFRYGNKWGSVEAIRWNVKTNRIRTLWRAQCKVRWISFVPGTLNAWVLGIDGKHLVLQEYNAQSRRLRVLNRFPAPDTENISIDWCKGETKASALTDDWIVILNRDGCKLQEIESNQVR
jgi:hypothetical protein